MDFPWAALGVVGHLIAMNPQTVVMGTAQDVLLLAEVLVEEASYLVKSIGGFRRVVDYLVLRM